jgi:hypothetical protein
MTDTSNEGGDSMLTEQKAREELYARATEKWKHLKDTHRETWEDYAAIGDALLEAQRQIMHVQGFNKPAGKGYQKAINAWLAKHKLNDMDPGVRSRLVTLTEHKPEVQEMMRGWEMTERMQWNHPNTVYRHWQAYCKGEGIRTAGQKKTLSAAKQTRQELAAAQNELHTLQKEFTKKSQDFDALQSSIDEKGGIVITVKEHARTQAEKLIAKAPAHWISDFAHELLAGIGRYAATTRKKKPAPDDDGDEIKPRPLTRKTSQAAVVAHQHKLDAEGRLSVPDRLEPVKGAEPAPKQSKIP